MAKMRKVKRSIATAILVWIGRRMLGRVQKQTLKSVTRKPRSASRPQRASKARSIGRVLRRTAQPATAPTRTRRGRRTAQRLAFALLSAAAVAALKVGVEHVIETEREQQVVTPDFDVFADDDE